MGKINTSRVILGGLVAGIVLDLLGFIIDGVLLAPRWADGMKRLGHADFSSNQVMWFNVIGLAIGIVLIWLYAAARPRLGPGAKTALCVGFAVWVISALLPNLGFMWVTGLFSRHLTAMTTAGALVEIEAGAIAGAALYKE